MTSEAMAIGVRPSWMMDLSVLMKIRLNALVLATTAGGFYMASPGRIDVPRMLVTCLGTALVAGGASALNQVQERAIDRLMERTRQRPVAEGRMGPTEASVVAYTFAVIGLLLLWLGVNRAAALVALATIVLYVVIYTPLKKHSSLATVVGAVPGALPPLIGWAGARGTLDPVAGALFLIMFFWQMPHFLAISWMYRDDYARAGLPMLAVVDTKGRVTGLQAMLWAATLLPVTMLPALFGLSGVVYAVSAFVLGAGLFAVAAAFAHSRTHANARRLFLASITYLPLLWILMAASKR
jgi:protoheme IX farnesyltransferase